MIYRPDLSMRIGIFICALVFFLSCENAIDQKKAKLHKKDEISAIDMAKRIHSRDSLFRHLPDSVTNKIFGDVKLEQDGKVLLFVCTIHDCTTCVNEQITLLVRLMKKDKFNDKVILVTDAQNLKVIKVNWGNLLKKNKILLRTKADLTHIYNYVGNPIYYLMSRDDKGSTDAFVVDPNTPDTTKKRLTMFNKLLSNNRIYKKHG